MLTTAVISLQGSNVSNPSNDVPHLGEGGVCTAGSECPTGTTWPVACQAGFYTPSTQYASCDSCPQGNS